MTVSNDVTTDTNRAPKNGGRLVMECLVAVGVDSVYHVPGGQTLAILDAAFDDRVIDFVAMRHEMGAAHAADGHFRITGQPGVCLVTAGPGLTHAVSAVGGAYRDRSGIVLISCNNRREFLFEEDAQAADHLAILRTMTKWSAQVTDVRALGRTLRTAFAIACSAPAGPVHVDIPRDILEDEVPPDVAVSFPLPPVVMPAVIPEPATIAAAARLLSDAQRPVIWVGRGVSQAHANDDLLSLAITLQAPIVTTYSGIGAVPTDHPLAFGPRTRHGTRVSHEVLEQSDCLLAIGMRLSSSSTHRWTTRLPALIHSDADIAAIGRHYIPEVALPGDAKLILTELNRRITAPAPDARASWLAKLDAMRTAWRSELEALTADDAQGRIHPAELIRQLGELCESGTIFCVDAGNPGIWSHLLRINTPNCYMKPVNYGQMGFALPAAIAAKRARPAATVVALIGDGSLGMSVGDIETAVRERLNIKIIVFNDCAYNNIRQEELFLTGKPRYFGVDLGVVDFAKVAEGFGAWSKRVSSREQTVTAIREALRQDDRPALVDVVINPDPNVWEMPF